LRSWHGTTAAEVADGVVPAVGAEDAAVATAVMVDRGDKN